MIVYCFLSFYCIDSAACDWFQFSYQQVFWIVNEELKVRCVINLIKNLVFFFDAACSKKDPFEKKKEKI